MNSASANSARSPGLLQRLRGWMGGTPSAAADVLPVRVGGTEYRQTTTTPASVLGFDQALVWVVIGLLAWGLVMVYSASIAMPDNPRFGKIAPTHFLMRHTMALVIGFVAALLAFQVSMATWERVAPWLFVGSIALLIAVLIPHVGTVVNGARRWLSLGIMNFQPSELAKFAVVIYASGYMVRKMEVKERFFRAVLPMAVAVAVVGALLLAEPDMGAFMVIAVIA
ncbi:MAG: cell division protein FtsW, partial [Comamonadaceae bacterium]